jgi:UDP-N-acetylmuramate--alanine ligase
MKSPHEIGRIHFVGIGGIGMSGIAELMHNLGYIVQGSDISCSANVARLKKLGIPVFIGHDASNVVDTQVVVVSSAIHRKNPELSAAQKRLIPVVRRAEMLAELMRLRSCVTIAGTHGKTTTTSMVAALMDAGSLDPTVVNGGIINAYGSNARLGQSDWMVVEADESDGSFLKLPAEVAVVTNIDPEHLEHYGSFDALQQAFRNFVEKVPFYGFAVMCIDHPVVQELIGDINVRRTITYGFSAQADTTIVDFEPKSDGCRFSLEVSARVCGKKLTIEHLKLPMPGRHNTLNATAAITVALGLGITPDVVRVGLAKFGGVRRRFTHVGDWGSARFYDDYGHHPVEISAVLSAARQTSEGRTIAIVQPHRYSRLRDLFADFCSCLNDADAVLVTPVYAAGEEPIDDINAEALVKGARARGHRSVDLVADEEELTSILSSSIQANDVVIFLGAGSISNWAYAMPGALAEFGDGPA